MAINKSFEGDEGSSDGGYVAGWQDMKPSAPPLELSEESEGSALIAPVVATPIPTATECVGSDADCSIIDNAQSDQDQEQSRTTAAGIAAGIIGLFLGGPVLALIAGGGAVYAARHRDGAAGDVARAIGDVALTAKDKARELDEKHHVVDKTKAAAEGAWEKARELDTEHNFFERIKNSLKFAYEKTIAINEEHHISDHLANAARTFFRLVSSKLHAKRNVPAASKPVN